MERKISKEKLRTDTYFLKVFQSWVENNFQESLFTDNKIPERA